MQDFAEHFRLIKVLRQKCKTSLIINFCEISNITFFIFN